MSLHLYNINYSFFWLKQKGQNKLKALVDLITEKMMKECQVTDMIWAMRDCMDPRNCVEFAEIDPDMTYSGKAFGLFILTDGKEVLSTAAYQLGRIISRWTPPKHRRKGYAREILKKIQTHYEEFSTLPLWIISEEKMWASNLGLGWQEGRTHVSEKDGHLERDFFPPSKRDQYEDRTPTQDEIVDLYRQQKQFVANAMTDCSRLIALDLKVRV
jgi:hypothetical protein